MEGAAKPVAVEEEEEEEKEEGDTLALTAGAAAGTDANEGREGKANDAAAAAQLQQVDEDEVEIIVLEGSNGATAGSRGRGRGRGRGRKRQRVQRPALAPEEQTLRIRVSELAVCVGLHPFKNIVETVEEHVYQDLHELLAADARSLGLELVSNETEVAALMKQAGPEAHQALRAAQRCACSSKKLHSVKEVAAAQATIAAALETAAKGKRLPQAGLAVIEGSLRDSLFCGFGRRHEEEALDELERLHGAPVTLRNEELWTWVFPAEAASIGPDRPPPLERKRCTLSRRAGDDEEEEDEEEEELVLEVLEESGDGERVGGDDGGKGEEKVGDAGKQASEGLGTGGDADADAAAARAGAGAAAAAREDPWKRGPHRHFTVVGAIDGMREEVFIQPDGEWRLDPVIVEVKNRVREEALRKQQAPPFYDQVQLLTYLLMVSGADEAYRHVKGDLVEVVKTGGGRRKRHRHHEAQPAAAVEAAAGVGEAAAKEEAEGGAVDGGGDEPGSPAALPMSITRILLDGGDEGDGGSRCLLDHRRLYYEHVVPALYEYTAFIYQLRCGDESMRRAFLAGDEDAKLQYIQRHLPFVQRPRFSGVVRRRSSREQGQENAPAPEDAGASAGVVVSESESAGVMGVVAAAAEEQQQGCAAAPTIDSSADV